MKNAILFALCGAMTMAAVEELRPLHYLSTDKPRYRPGEVVYVRDVILDGISNCPIKDNGSYLFNMLVKGPRGDEVFRTSCNPESSTAGISWTIPDDASGGVYTVRVENRDPSEGAPAERTFEVLAYRVPRIKSQIEFLRRGYLPGEECSAVIEFERAEGGVPEGAVVTATAIVDGVVIYESDSLQVTGGSARADFKIPSEIAEGDGTLAFTIRDGGVVEGASKSIPILVDSYTVDFYPECGELVAGVPTKMYIEAVQRNGKGADISGKIVRQSTGEAIADFTTVLDGRGCVEVTAAAGEKLLLVVENAATGAKREFQLPPAVACTSFTALDAVPPEAAMPMRFRILRSPESAQAPTYAVLCKREKELSRVTLEEGATEFELNAGAACEGVLTVTLYSSERPLAERLVFARPAGVVDIAVEPVGELQVSPGAKVRLRVTTRDAGGNAVGATVGVTVTDESVLKMVDRREWAPRLREMVYLENEVRAFADADRYFGDAENGWRYVDLLLGTQGWRRFVFSRQADVAANFPELLRRIMAPAVHLRTVRSTARKNKGLFGRARPLGEDDAVYVDEVKAVPMMAFAAAPAAGAVVEDVVEEEAAVDMMAMDMVDGAERNGRAALVEKEAMAVEVGAADVAFNGAMEVMEDKEVPMAVAAPKPVMARKMAPQKVVVGWTREYAHRVRQNRKPGDRVDFAETIYWSAGIDTDPKTGTAEFEFEMPDTVGTFAVMADGFCANGALGEGDYRLTSAPAFYAEVKVPPFLTIGDVIELPLVLVNNSAAALDGVNGSLECAGGLELVDVPDFIGGAPLQPGERRRVVARLRAKAAGEASFTFAAVAGAYSDRITRKAEVVSPYFPEEFNASGRVDDKNPLALEFELGEKTVNGSQHTAIQLYLSPEANLEAALNALLRQPHGCFEQTSSTNYPLVMAQQYFTSHSGVDAEKIREAQKLLDEGYKKLTEFECKSRGYEWFGDDPGHEALTAYGLMEFADMAKVMQVDAKMMDNTRQWLMQRRDGNGGFQRNSRSLDSFGRAPENTTNAYIVWAMLEAGEDAAKLSAEVNSVLEKASAADDAYLNGLAANIAFLAKRQDDAVKVGRRLAKWQKADGTLDNDGETITCSGGISRQLECASLAALAWVRLGDEFVAATEKTMNYLASCCKDGKFGSTQSTVLVLKAINAYDQAFAKPLAAGSVQLLIDGAPWGEPLKFDDKSSGRLEFPDCGLRLVPGKHRLELRMTNGCKLSASMHVTTLTRQPANAGKLKFSTEMKQDKLAEGDPAQLVVTLANAADDAANMPLAIVSIPCGLDVNTAQLRELVDAKRIAAYELQDNAVVLYWRGLNAGETVSVPIALQAAVPGKWTAAASCAYLYYTDEEKQYIPGVSVEIIAE